MTLSINMALTLSLSPEKLQEIKNDEMLLPGETLMTKESLERLWLQHREEYFNGGVANRVVDIKNDLVSRLALILQLMNGVLYDKVKVVAAVKQHNLQNDLPFNEITVTRIIEEHNMEIVLQGDNEVNEADDAKLLEADDTKLEEADEPRLKEAGDTKMKDTDDTKLKEADDTKLREAKEVNDVKEAKEVQEVKDVREDSKVDAKDRNEDNEGDREEDNKKGKECLSPIEIYFDELEQVASSHTAANATQEFASNIYGVLPLMALKQLEELEADEDQSNDDKKHYIQDAAKEHFGMAESLIEAEKEHLQKCVHQKTVSTIKAAHAILKRGSDRAADAAAMQHDPKKPKKAS